MVDGGWWVVDGVPLFGSLNLLIIIWYIVKVYIYVYKRNQGRTKVLWVLNFGEVVLMDGFLLILLYFIRISLSTPKNIFLF